MQIPAAVFNLKFHCSMHTKICTVLRTHIGSSSPSLPRRCLTFLARAKECLAPPALAEEVWPAGEATATAPVSEKEECSLSDRRMVSDDSMASATSLTFAAAASRRSTSGMSPNCRLSFSASWVPLLSSWIAIFLWLEGGGGEAGGDVLSDFGRVEIMGGGNSGILPLRPWSCKNVKAGLELRSG